MRESRSWTGEGATWPLMHQLALAPLWSLFAQDLNVCYIYLNSQSTPDMI